MGIRATTVDSAIARIAARQHGSVTRAQLLDVGLGDGAIAYRGRHGRLHRVHPGVYSVGYRGTTPVAKAMAAVLACGPHAVLSHRWAAALWELSEFPRGAIDVISPALHRRDGIVAHRSPALAARDVTVRQGIPATTPARTLVDLADVLDDRALARAVNEALLRHLVRRIDLADVLARVERRRALTRLREFVERADAPTRSVLEDAFLAFLVRYGLPRPEVNQRIEGFEVDMLWRAPRLVVELDGRTSHDLPRSFEDDRERDAELTAAGYRVVRVTWWRLRRHPTREGARLARLLGGGAASAENPQISADPRAARLG